MKKEEVVQELRERFKEVDTSSINETIAIQVDLKDEDGGTLYLEVKDKVLSIEPYEYYDRNVILSVSSNDLLSIIDKKLDPVESASNGILNADGDLSKALEIFNLSKPKIEVKEIEEKVEAKTEEEVKVEVDAKKVVKPEEKVKPAAKSTSKTAAKAANKTKGKAKTKTK